MKEITLEEKIKLMEKSLVLQENEIEKMRHEFVFEIDKIKILLETIKQMMTQNNPGLEKDFNDLRDKLMIEVNPEML